MAAKKRLLAGIPLLVALGIAPAGAIEAPLSRASFERAIEEGHACRKPAKAGPYVVKRGADPVLATVLDDLFEAALEEEVSDSYVTLRLATPYTRVRLAACQARLYGGPLDVEALWDSARTWTTVTLDIDTKTISRPTLPMSADAEAKYGPVPSTRKEAGPWVAAAALRRGEGDGAVLVPSLGECNAQCEFPAAALQGEGPFFLVLRTADPDAPIVLKLKSSLLRKP